jgi:hypothetical protein
MSALQNISIKANFERCQESVLLKVYSHTHISVSLILTHLYRAVNDFRN